MKYLIAIFLLLLPTPICRVIISIMGLSARYSISKNSKVGFSIVIANSIELKGYARINHFNIIYINSLSCSDGVIGKFNYIKGAVNLILNNESAISKRNVITNNSALTKDISTLKLGYNSIIGSNHQIDLTSNVSIGDNSILAGIGTQIWTHSFYHSKLGKKRWRIDGDVVIGNNIYIGSRCIICLGVEIKDAITIGAGSCISKSLIKPGLYVNQALRFIDFDPDIKILSKNTYEEFN